MMKKLITLFFVCLITLFVYQAFAQVNEVPIDETIVDYEHTVTEEIQTDEKESGEEDDFASILLAYWEMCIFWALAGLNILSIIYR